jgi:nitric oxide reductase subunit B
MVLFGLQMVFGLLSAAKYLGPDPLLYILPFDVTKVIHTNLLIVWVLTGFMGATYWMVPDESRTELYSTKLAYWQLVLWVVMGVTAVIGYLFRYGTGNKLLEQPLPHKIVIVIVMLMFLYNVGMTIWRRALHHHRRRAAARPGRWPRAVPAGAAGVRELHRVDLLPLVDDPPVGRRRVGDDPGRLPGLPADPPVGRRPRGDGEVALRDRRPGVHRRHPRHRAPLLLGRRADLLAADRRVLQRAGAGALVGMAMYAYSAMRRSGLSHPNTLALHWTLGSAIFTLFGAGLLGLAHTFPGGQQVDARHADHRDARPRRVLRRLRDDRAGDDQLRAAGDDTRASERGTSLGYWAFWLQISGMFGMTLSFATAGIGRSTWSASWAWATSTRS